MNPKKRETRSVWTLRLSDSERRAVESAASRAKRSPREWARMALLDAARADA